MDDVAALCPRVIVIDKGKLSFDGALDDLVLKTKPEKRLILRFSRDVPRAELEAFGQVVACEKESATLQIAQEKVNDVVTRALSSLPVRDLTVENPPLEEVMSELFARTRAARDSGEKKDEAAQ